MKIKISILFFGIIFSSIAQKLTINDLHYISEQKNWENINKYLMKKGWEYYESEKGNDSRYNTILWTYNKSNFDDKAQGWFTLYTYEGYPNKISYEIYNKPSYTVITNALKSKGYKYKDGEINDNELISNYENKKYILKISTEKGENDFGSSITIYRFLLIKKSGIYDVDNGKKIKYYPNSNSKQYEYSLLNGKLNGKFIKYYENGKIEIIKNFINGIENGEHKEFNEKGNILYEGIMKNGKRNGIFTYYYYDEDNDELILKLTTNYIEGKKNGRQKIISVLKHKTPEIISFTNFIDDIKEGKFQEMKGDSLIIGNYHKDKLNGRYRIYFDLDAYFLGKPIKTDTTKLILLTSGYYANDKKNGYWKYYDITKTLRKEGKYIDDKKDGEWKYYYSNITNENNEYPPYAKKLFLIENYKNGKLNGKVTRLSNLIEKKYKCNKKDINNKPIDTCVKYIYEKIRLTSHYKDGKLNGIYILKDSTGLVVEKGEYINGFKEGKWLNKIKLDNGIVNYTGNYKNDKKNGQWLYTTDDGHIIVSENYDDGDLDGDVTFWKNDKPTKIMHYEFGNLKEITYYDTTSGIKTINYKFYYINENQISCNKTIYNKDKIISQEYLIKKTKDFEYEKINDIINDKTLSIKEGFYIEKMINGKVLISGKYKNNKKNGEWKFLDYNQNVVMILTYRNDIIVIEKYLDWDGRTFSGKYIYVDKKNNIKEVRKIKEGLRDGTTVIYDLNTNKKIKKIKYKNGLIK